MLGLRLWQVRASSVAVKSGLFTGFVGPLWELLPVRRAALRKPLPVCKPGSLTPPKNRLFFFSTESGVQPQVKLLNDPKADCD